MSFVRAKITIATAFLLLVTFGCGGGGGGGGTTGPPGDGNGNGNDGPLGNTVTLTAQNTFSPQNLAIDVGQTVTWENAVAVAHTITPDGHMQWERHLVPADANHTFSVTFEEAGEFDYFCEFHGFPGGGMHGTITVNP
ncbi:MAG: plastocyanin/azurin family copper-binding protein [Gemmatimonadota bacterium]|nr:plastocyanin/azurin family copper-binding protein [Gemmatimonadota bacterium]